MSADPRRVYGIMRPLTALIPLKRQKIILFATTAIVDLTHDRLAGHHQVVPGLAAA